MNIDFNSETFKKFQSKSPGDGGINPGHLSFVDALQHYAGISLNEIRKIQGWNRQPDKCNLGGPCVVALVNAAQLTNKNDGKKNVKYFGAIAEDKAGQSILSFLRKTPVDISNYKIIEG